MTRPPAILPAEVRVFERGWLSSNTVLFDSDAPAVVDTGYSTHAPQTVALLRAALGGRRLARILNTHLHSDHCGGNAALQAEFPDVRTSIPPGLAPFVADWNAEALTYAPTGQVCPRFHYDDLLEPGQNVRLGRSDWQIHAAPGHDPHSVILFEPASRTLISADALWDNGFGIVFPEIEGEQAFDEVAATFDVIESLRPATVIPGHGSVFGDVQGALQRARTKLERFVAEPRKHARHAAKVLLKFKLLELQRASESQFTDWALRTPYFEKVHQRFFADTGKSQWLAELIDDLVRSGAAMRQKNEILNS